MGYGAILWLLISLASISLTGNHPGWALTLAGGGGLGLGIYLWRQVGARPAPARPVRPPRHWLSRLYRGELLLLGPALVVLLFVNRLPVVLSWGALGWLLLLALGRLAARGRLASGTPLDLPFLLLLIPALTSLYAAVDWRESGHAVCMLIAGMAFGYVLIDALDTERKINLGFVLFLAVGVGVALSGFLLMSVPGAKVPLMGAFHRRLLHLGPSWINSNYFGGTLAFFLPAAFWSLALGYRFRVWTGIATAVIGMGLLLTQSRGALLGVGVAIVLAGACWNRWIRWGLPGLALAIGLAVYGLGAEVLVGPLAGGGGVERSLAGRQELWQRAVYIAQDFPFTGIGLRSFPRVVELLYPTFLIAPGAGLPHAHNLYLEIAAALGIPGLAAFGALLGAWGGMVGDVLVRARHYPGQRAQAIAALGLAGGMAAHLFYSITDAVALGEKAGLVFWGVLGLTGALWKAATARPDEA